MKPIISKAHSRLFFLFFIFHFLFYFLVFNSRDMPMLWVLNLLSRLSPTKLWKWIFDLRCQNFFYTQSWHIKKFSHIGSVTLRGKFQIWVKNFDENFFFNKNFLCSLNQCAHVLHRPETVKNF